MIVASIVLGGVLFGIASAQVSVPSNSDFLRRSWHRTTVVRNRLYIYGGENSQLINGQPDTKASRTVKSILSIDLGTSWTNATVDIQQFDGSDDKFTKYPGLWSEPHSDSLYVFGGDAGFQGAPTETTPNRLLKFTTNETGDGTWSTVEPANPDVYYNLFPAASPACITCAGLGLWSGSYINNYTTYKIKHNHMEPIAGLITHNFSSAVWENVTIDPFTTKWAFGEMVCLPSIGEKGVVMFLGGAPGGLLTTVGGEVTTLGFGNITMYDPVRRTWYWQATTGSAPPGRLQFCVASVQSHNSTEIFIYGGQTGINTPMDDTYVLTIPGFHWIRGPSGTARKASRCVVGGNRQMISVGGIDKGNADGWSKPDPWTQGIGVFDMSAFAWRDDYDAHAPDYVSPAPVQEWYQNGGMSSVTWSNTAAEALFASVSSIPSGSSPADSSNNDARAATSPGVIAGAVVGGVVAVALSGAIAWAMFTRHRRKRRGVSSDEPPAYDAQPKHELDNTRLPPQWAFPPVELSSERSQHELPDTVIRYELSTSETKR